MIDLSYVVLCYRQRNQHRQLRAVLRKMPAHVRTRVEVVVVHDSPDDGQGDALARDWAQEEFGRVLVLQNEKNAGAAASRNAGLSAATGTWVTFVDGDDLILPWHAELMLTQAEVEPSVDTIGCREVTWASTAPPPDEMLERLDRAEEGFSMPNVSWTDGWHWGLEPLSQGKGSYAGLNVLHAGLHRRIGCPMGSELYWRWLGIGGEDLDHSVRMMRRGRVGSVPRCLQIYRYLTVDQREGSKTYKQQAGLSKALLRYRQHDLTGEKRDELRTALFASEQGRVAVALQDKIERGEVSEFVVPPVRVLVEASR